MPWSTFVRDNVAEMIIQDINDLVIRYIIVIGLA